MFVGKLEPIYSIFDSDVKRAAKAALEEYNKEKNVSSVFSVVNEVHKQIADVVRYNITYDADFFPTRFVNTEKYLALSCSAMVHLSPESQLKVESVNCHEVVCNLALFP